MPWYHGLVVSKPICDPPWSDDFERAALGPDWTAFPYPDETLSNPYAGQIMPIIISGALAHPTSGSSTQPDTEKRASILRTVQSDCNAQQIEAVVHNIFQTGTPGSNFRAHVDLMLIADPSTGTHMMIQLRTESGGGFDGGTSYLQFGVKFYYGSGGSDYEFGESISNATSVLPSDVGILSAVIFKDTRRYIVTYDGQIALDAIAPIVIPWGGHQGVSIRWSNGTAIDGDFLSPTISDANGGSYLGSPP